MPFCIMSALLVLILLYFYLPASKPTSFIPI